HALFRESVARVLNGDPGIEIDHCGSIREALALLAQRPRDLVLLDHDLGSERASQFLPAARQIGFEGRVLVVTAWISDTEARRLMRQGVSGIFLKQGPLTELTESIRVVANGGTWLDRGFAAREYDLSRSDLSRSAGAALPASPPVFNERQRKALRFVLEGLLNKKTAWR